MPAAAIPLIIGSGISAGASIYAAKKGSDSAKQAAQQQTQAVDKGIASTRETMNQLLPLITSLYEQGQAQYQPYTQAGQSSLNSLMYRMGMGAHPDTMRAPTKGPPLTGTSSIASLMAGFPGMSPAAEAQSASVLVQMPDGSRTMVPRQFAQMITMRGGRVLDGGPAAGRGGNRTPLRTAEAF